MRRQNPQQSIKQLASGSLILGVLLSFPPKNSFLKMISALILASGLAILPSTSFAQMGEHFVMCKHKKDVRTLRIDKPDDSQCKAVYTKQGVDQVIGSSVLSSNGCNEFLSGVRKTLEDASWTCREVKESRLSNLNTEESN